MGLATAGVLLPGSSQVEPDAHLRRGHRPAHHHVPIELGSRLRPEAHLGRLAARDRVHLMRGRSDSAPHDGVANRKGEGKPRRARPVGHLLGDAVAVRHPLRGAEIAGSHHGGEAPFPAHVVPHETLIDVDPHFHLGTRRDVTHLLAEEGGAVLFQQRGAPALDQGLFEALPGAGPEVHLADDGLLAHHEGEAAHRCLVGQGKRIGDVEGLRVGVVENLGETDAGESASGVALESGRAQGKLAAVDGDQAATAGRVGCVGVGCVGVGCVGLVSGGRGGHRYAHGGVSFRWRTVIVPVLRTNAPGTDSVTNEDATRSPCRSPPPLEGRPESAPSTEVLHTPGSTTS